MSKGDDFDIEPVTAVDSTSDLRVATRSMRRRDLYVRLLEEHFIMSTRLVAGEGSISEDEERRLYRLCDVIDRLRLQSSPVRE